MTLKWSNAGIFLASGADDGAVLVWTLDGCEKTFSFLFFPLFRFELS